MSKKYVKTFRVDSQTNRKIEALMQKYELNLSDTINKLINDATKTKKLEKKQKNEDEIKCPSLILLDGIGYHCAIKPQNPKKLGNGSLEHAIAICNSHIEMKELLEEHKNYEETFKERPSIIYCTHPEKHLYENVFDGRVIENTRVVYCPVSKKIESIHFCKSHGKIGCKFIGRLEVDKNEIILKKKVNKKKRRGS